MLCLRIGRAGTRVISELAEYRCSGMYAAPGGVKVVTSSFGEAGKGGSAKLNSVVRLSVMVFSSKSVEVREGHSFPRGREGVC